MACQKMKSKDFLLELRQKERYFEAGEKEKERVHQASRDDARMRHEQIMLRMKMSMKRNRERDSDMDS